MFPFNQTSKVCLQILVVDQYFSESYGFKEYSMAVPLQCDQRNDILAMMQ